MTSGRAAGDAADPTDRFVVLHVCTANICRSPMAERIMRAEVDRRFGPRAGEIEVHGAGTYGGRSGEAMSGPAAEVLRAAGYDPSDFRATWLRESAVAEADLVLTATADHRGEVLRLHPQALRRTFTLKELARLAADLDGADLGPGGPASRLRVLVSLADGRRATARPASRDADDVDDPYGLSDEVYRRTAEEIRAAVVAVVEALAGTSAGEP